jgi:subtilisin family serine protease
MANEVEEQVERILDEESERTIQVIVHMDGPDHPLDPAAHNGDTGEELQLDHSARAVLPEPVRAARADALSTGAKGGGVPSVRPSTPKLAPSVHGAAPGVAALRRSNQAALAALLDSEPARRNLAERPETVTTYWTSRSAYLELDRDDLQRLVADAPGIDAVYPNQWLHLPPVAESRELPAAVLEDSAASWGLIRTGALATWGAYQARGAGVTVGVLDTGVDATHPDLIGKVKAWAEFDSMGHHVVETHPHDSGDHGTHVCGTIVGGNASGQWIGMAPEAQLAVALVLNGRSGTTPQILAGIDWAVDQGVDVLNMSLSAPVFDWAAPKVYLDSFRTCLLAGIPVVAAVGNRGAMTGASTGSDYHALAVGATDYRDVSAGFSGGMTHFIKRDEAPPLIYTKPDISAPGVAVTSATLQGLWKASDGTSMASPHVSGAIALLLSAVPEIRTELTGAERALFLRRQIMGSADELGEAGHDSRYGWGRLNVLRAIALARMSAS